MLIYHLVLSLKNGSRNFKSMTQNRHYQAHKERINSKIIKIKDQEAC